MLDTLDLTLSLDRDTGVPELTSRLIQLRRRLEDRNA